MKHIYIIILFLLAFFSQAYATSNPTSGLTEISTTGLSTADGHTFHLYTSTGKLYKGYSEIYIALTDNSGNFVNNFTVSNFRPIYNDSISTPVGYVQQVSGQALYKTWFSFIKSGTWALSFTYSIGSTTNGVTSSNSVISTSIKTSAIVKVPNLASPNTTVNNDTITQVGWFKDRHCVGMNGANVPLPLKSSCGLGCGGVGTSNMVVCWKSGLGIFLYDPSQSGDTLTSVQARTSSYFYLFDAQSKELTRAFLEKLPSAASGHISIKVTGYWTANGTPSNKIQTIIPELIADSIDHYLPAFHLYSIEGTYINDGIANSYSGFSTNSYKLTQADLAPSNISAVNYTGGTTVTFKAPTNEGNKSSNLSGYTVRVYNNGVLQNNYTTTTSDTTVTAINIPGLTATSSNTFTVSGLYSSSGVEVESAQSSAIDSTLTGINLTVINYPTYSDFNGDPYTVKLIDSFTYNNSQYYVTVANPASFVVGSQSVKAYINKQNNILQPYPVVADSFYVKPQLFMESMPMMGIDNSDPNFAWSATDSAYESTLDFLMAPDYRVSLKVYDTNTQALVAGTNIDSMGGSSTLWWDVYVNNSMSTGVTNITSNGISIYPTVSQGEINVISPSDAKIKILDLYGKTLAYYQSSGNITLNLNVTSGLYLVSVESAGKTSVKKVIINK